MRREGEVVLIYYEDQPALYARIEFIEPDIKRGWYQVTLSLLTIPTTQTVTWILREEYIDGGPFTMGGKAMRLEEVKRISVARSTEAQEAKSEDKASGKPATIIPFKKP